MVALVPKGDFVLLPRRRVRRKAPLSERCFLEFAESCLEREYYAPVAVILAFWSSSFASTNVERGKSSNYQAGVLLPEVRW
jgi:hypothetical protein